MSKERKIVGILTVPVPTDRVHWLKHGNAYNAVADIRWLKDAGFDVLLIPHHTRKFKYYFNRINGLFLPGGPSMVGNDKAYYECCKGFINLAIRANDRGDHFPVWGVCMGMQQMMIIAEGHDNLDLLERFDSSRYLTLPLDLTPDGYESQLIQSANPQTIEVLTTKNVTINNHMMGLSPETFRKLPKLNDFYRIVSTNKDRQGKVFVSTIEAYKYPFWAFQWHPELNPFLSHFPAFLAYQIKLNHHTPKPIHNPHKVKILSKLVRGKLFISI